MGRKSIKRRKCAAKSMGKSVLLVIFGVLFLAPAAAFCEVNGSLALRQVSSEIIIAVGNPPPQSIIVEQRTAGKVVGTEPQAQKVRSGSVTWLIRDPQAGRLHLKTQFQQPVVESSATIKYKDRHSGEFVQRVIRP